MMGICPVVTMPMLAERRADGQTDVTKLTDVFRHYAKEAKELKIFVGPRWVSAQW